MRRVAENEANFREINESLRRMTGGMAGPVAFYCECANEDCELPIPMSPDEYEEVRRDPRQFVVLPGHVLPEIEEVVAERESYAIVRKLGEAGDVAEARDERVRR